MNMSVKGDVPTFASKGSASCTVSEFIGTPTASRLVDDFFGASVGVRQNEKDTSDAGHEDRFDALIKRAARSKR